MFFQRCPKHFIKCQSCSLGRLQINWVKQKSVWFLGKYDKVWAVISHHREVDRAWLEPVCVCMPVSGQANRGSGELGCLSLMGQTEPLWDSPPFSRLGLSHVLTFLWVTLGSCACKVTAGTIRLENWKEQSRGEMDRTYLWGPYALYLNEKNASAFLLSVCSC